MFGSTISGSISIWETHLIWRRGSRGAVGRSTRAIGRSASIRRGIIYATHQKLSIIGALRILLTVYLRYYTAQPLHTVPASLDVRGTIRAMSTGARQDQVCIVGVATQVGIRDELLPIFHRRGADSLSEHLFLHTRPPVCDKTILTLQET